ncbi:unnamed protein product [Notodromas monacha]|uniref:Huntingtin n=1 Tax=Notodromas monacha TaxID=399045 RepID=A0A7R9BMU9_9CRUS|nr:unnamed protein product [Notodromas monacha]CAG0916913.1 unnamed protein product [Notodromas monacha]
MTKSYAPARWGLTDMCGMYEVPADALQDPYILKDYLWRLQTMGWTNRKDFEEAWMALLAVCGVSVNACCGGGAGDCEDTDVDMPVLARSGSLSLSGLTGLLQQTLLSPSPGFPLASSNTKYENYTDRIRPSNAGVTSAPWIRRNHEPADPASLDFVIGNLKHGRGSTPGSPIGSSWATKLPPWTGPGESLSAERKRRLLALEVLTLHLVTEFGQAQVLHDSFISFRRNYLNLEDELVVPYLVLGLSGTTAVLAAKSIGNYEKGKLGEFPEPTSAESAGWEVMKECVTVSLRGIPIACQVFGLKACQSLMQTKWAKLVFMSVFPILPDYLRLNLIGASMAGSYLNEHHVKTVWETAFKLLQEFSGLMADSDLQTQIHVVCLEVISSVERISPPILSLMQGVLRLADVRTLDIATRDLLIKVCSRHFGRIPLSVAVPMSGVQLVLLETYESLQSESCSDIAKEHVSDEIALVAQEWVNHIFARLGTRSSREALEWARILPRLPDTLIPTSELVNKLLSEFISSKQGNVESVARVLVQILRKISTDEAIEWCLLSVGAFLQRSPLPVALWFVTTLLLGARVALRQRDDPTETILAILLEWHLSRSPENFKLGDFWIVYISVSSFLTLLDAKEKVDMVASAFASVCVDRDPEDDEFMPSLTRLLTVIKQNL